MLPSRRCRCCATPLDPNPINSVNHSGVGSENTSTVIAHNSLTAVDPNAVDEIQNLHAVLDVAETSDAAVFIFRWKPH